MKRKQSLGVAITLAVLPLMLLGMASVLGQGASPTTIGINAEEMKAVAIGWSATRQILGTAVYTDAEANQQIGVVNDLIVTPDATSYAIVATGGFLGLGKHDVAIPIDQLKTEEGRLILPGATKASLKAMPAFVCAKE